MLVSILPDFIFLAGLAPITAMFTSGVSPDCHVHFRVAPMVLDFGKSKDLAEGDDLELLCDVKDYPDAVVTWYKNLRIVNASTRDDNHVTLQDGGEYKNARLLIRHVDYNDTGDYTCETYITSLPNRALSEKVTITITSESHRLLSGPVYFLLVLLVVETNALLLSGLCLTLSL